MNRKKSLLFFIVLLLCSVSYAQQNDNLVTGNFQNANFNEFVKRVEAQTNFHFYYEPSQFDSISITISVKDAHLPSILDKIFNNTQWHYTIDKDNNVFITKGFSLASNLPYGFFTGETDTAVTAEKRQPMEAGYINQKKNAKQEISIENKVFDIGIKRNGTPKGKVNIAGYVRDAQTGEAISGALIYLDHPSVQVKTDQFGYYSLILPAGHHILNIIAPGMYDTRRQVMLYSDGNFDIDLDEKVFRLKEVLVEAGKERNVRSTTMGMDKLSMTAIKQIPAVMGEVDVLRAVLTLPGVKSVGEASTGLNVRGGATDQNLILFNGANIYNPSHLFGFFSAFDPDVIKDVTLYKSSIPAKYGGRISSVLDITSLDGNDKKISGSAGIGPLTSKLTLEGPLVKDKTTFVVGGRTTYSDWLFKVLPKDYRKSHASFQDGTIHINQKINKKNNVYINGYISGDKFNLNSDTTYQYHNKNANLNWKHNFNNRFYGVFMAGIDHYDYNVGFNGDSVNAYKLTFNINQYKFNADFSYFLNNKHTLSFGLNSLLYNVQSGTITPSSKYSLIVPDSLEAEHALESAVYLGDHYNISDDFSVDGGIRFSVYNYLGPKHVNNYAPGLPKDVNNVLSTNFYPSGKVIKTYMNPEYRLSARYSLTDNMSVKASVNSLSQYIHMLTNTTTISPTDVWKLSDPNIKPQQGTQVALGLYRNFKNNTIETSVEVYYKWFKHYLDYKSGAVLVMNHNIETDVINTKGTAYGVELLLKKATGKVNGWLTYSYSRSLLQQDDPIAGEKINNGDQYPSNFDQPHNVTFSGNFRFTHRFSVSLNATYSTGRPITLPIAEYDYAGSVRVLYSNRNEYRIPDYFRTDFSMSLDGNHKIHQFFHNSWTLGVYNVTGRKNAYSVYFTSENGHVKGYKLSIFGTAIPFITYNIRF
ncbi:MAG TPA: carboxypeptidase-like regulatory domain-containing protein [Hanamia sp.]|nr:carboxypeptidase-like regulatory domain-containing protein [Hanamia sp.]